MMRLLILLFCLLFSLSCASVHPGNYAQPEDSSNTKESEGAAKKSPTKSGLLISGIENTGLSSEFFTAVDLTFENTTSEWARIKSITLDFGDEVLNREIKFPVGSDLAEWGESAQQRKNIRDYNTELILGAIAGAGGALAYGG